MFLGIDAAADNAVISLFSTSAVMYVLCSFAMVPCPMPIIIIREVKYIAKIMAKPKDNQNQIERLMLGIITYFLIIRKPDKIFFTLRVINNHDEAYNGDRHRLFWMICFVERTLMRVDQCHGIRLTEK